jgi:hypothetical protein
MTKLARTLPLILLVVLGAGCTHGASSSSLEGPATSAPTKAAGDVPPPPRVGQCRNTPEHTLATRNLNTDVGIDNTPVVDCSKPHTLETVEVIKPVETLTLAEARQLTDSCAPGAYSYLGISFPAVRSLIMPVAYWPSPAQRAAGQNWLRCDVAVQSTTGCCDLLASQTGSLRGEVGSDPVRFQLCIDQDPEPSRAQPLTSCKKRHRAEALPAFLELNVTDYPSATILSRKGQAGCARLVAGRPDLKNLVVTPDWRSKAHWPGGTLLGRCWIRKTTGLLPPRR